VYRSEAIRSVYVVVVIGKFQKRLYIYDKEQVTMSAYYLYTIIAHIAAIFEIDRTI